MPYKIFMLSAFSTPRVITSSKHAENAHFCNFSFRRCTRYFSLGDGSNVSTVSELRIGPAVWPHSRSPPLPLASAANPLPNLALDISAGKYDPLSTYPSGQNSAARFEIFTVTNGEFLDPLLSIPPRISFSLLFRFTCLLRTVYHLSRP